MDTNFSKLKPLKNSTPQPPSYNRSPVSRYMMMKSKKHQLNTILNDYSESKGSENKKNKRQLDPIKQQLNKRNINRHHSNDTFENSSKKKLNGNFLLSEYSEFMIRSGMADNAPFRNAVSPDNDRNNSTKDIQGASTYIKQYESDQPLDTHYDKLETFQNYKKSFVKRRQEAGNINSKRSHRTDDISGAVPINRNSITESRRIKLTSSNLQDLISDIEKYRKKLLAKNGHLNLIPKHKTNNRNKQQTFHLFDNSVGEDPNPRKIDAITPKRRDMTIDSIGRHRSKRQFKSQPRVNPTVNRTQFPQRVRTLKDGITSNNDIEFRKLDSKRHERLNKLQNYFSNVANKENKFMRDDQNKSMVNIPLQQSTSLSKSM